MSTHGRANRQLCFAVDAAGYGGRNDLYQAELQRDMLTVLDRSARAAGADRLTWRRQPAGDGELAVLPPGTPEALVVDRFIRELDAELRRYNSPRQSWARLRLRVAIHFGRLTEADNGFAGPAPIAVTSLVNSDLLRGALLGAPDANLAVLLSPQLFEDTVATLSTTLQPEEFRKVHISEPKFDGDAWLLVPGRNAHAVPLREPDGGRPPAGSGTRNITFGAGGTQNYNEGTQYIGQGPR